MTLVWDLRTAAAMTWARGVFAFSEATTLQQSPWSIVVRLKGTDADAYLKLSKKKTESRLLGTLSPLASNFLPQVIASEAHSGWLLLRDHGGVAIGNDDAETMDQAIKNYASLQKQVVGNKKILNLLPPLRDCDELFAEFERALLCEVAHREDERASTSRRAAEIVRTSKARAGALIRLSGQLPETINHNDFHEGNIVRCSPNEVLLCDWDDAVRGPPGLSGAGQAVLGASSGAASRSLGTYLTALKAQGYPDYELLARVLPGCALWGLLSRLVELLSTERPADGKLAQMLERTIIAGTRSVVAMLRGIDKSAR